MMKHILALLALLVSCHTFAADMTALRQATHLVTVYSDEGDELGSGSGVMIAPTLMLTAAHVASSGSMTVGKTNAPAILVVAIDKELDLALVRVALGCPCVPVAETAPAVDSPVIVVGYPVYPSLHEQIVTRGEVQGVTDHRLTMTAPVAAGNSGGGVFVLERGQWRLAGILVELTASCMGFMCYPVYHLSRAVDTVTIQDFLRGHA